MNEMIGKYSAHRLIALFCLLGTMSFQAKSQYPNTNIYMMDYTLQRDSLFLEYPEFLTAFNDAGYNNQPFFISDKTIYLTSNYHNTEKTEIIKLDLSKKSLSRVTKTSESEYSPVLAPDGKFFTCIRVERDGKDQSLWKYPIDQSNGGKRLLDNLNNIGYHCWLSESEVALFIVDTPVKLILADVETGNTRYLLDNIGRCIKSTPQGDLIIVHKLLDNKWYLKKYNPDLRTFKIITETLPGKEDFEILPDGSIIMANGSEIWKYSNNRVIDTWKKMDDLSDLGIKNISRISSSSNKILFVDNQN